MKKIYPILFILLFVLPYYGFAQKTKKNKKSSSKVEIFSSQEQYREQSNTLIDAVVLKNAGKYAEAEQQLKILLVTNPSYDIAHFEYAKLLLMQNKVKAVIEELQTALTLCDTNRWIKAALAEAYDISQQYDKSEKLWQNLSLKYPENQEYIDKYAIALIYQNKLKEAVDAYNIMEVQMGVNEDIIIAKRNIWLQLKKPENAVKEMNKLEKAFPNDIRYPLDIADIYISNKMEEKAMPYLQKAGEIDPTNPQINTNLYNYYIENKNNDSAYKYLKRAFASPELNIDEKIKILMSFYGKNLQKQMAYSLLDSLVKAHPDNPKAWAISADFLNQDNQFRQAKEAFERVLDLDNSKYPIWEQYLPILLALQEFELVVTQSLEAQSLFPMQALPYLTQGMAHVALKQSSEAVNALKEGLNYATGNALVATFYYTLAQAYMIENNFEEVVVNFENALQKEPQNDMLLNEYSYYLAEQGKNLNYALQLSEKSLKSSTHVAYLDTYAWILFKQGKYVEAKTWLEKALKNGGENDADILDHYCQILQQLNETTLYNEYKIKLQNLQNHITE